MVSTCSTWRNLAAVVCVVSHVGWSRVLRQLSQMWDMYFIAFIAFYTTERYIVSVFDKLNDETGSISSTTRATDRFAHISYLTSSSTALPLPLYITIRNTFGIRALPSSHLEPLTLPLPLPSPRHVPIPPAPAIQAQPHPSIPKPRYTPNPDAEIVYRGVSATHHADVNCAARVENNRSHTQSATVQ